MEQKVEGSLALEQKQRNIIVIEATQHQDTAKLRVAAYARVSSASDDQGNSFAAQTRYFTALISSNEKWTLADIYADEAVTGTSAEKREDFQRLLADCRRGRVDRVITKSISRFSRNTKDCLMAIRELKSLGIGVLFEKENIDTATMSGEMMTAFFASFAQAESQSISGNMRWSFTQRMQSGTFVPMQLPFGYMRVDKRIEINVTQAEIVCRIFSDYLSGMGMRQIAEQLNQENILTGSDEYRNWTYQAVSRILRNEKYIGDSLWQKTYRTDTLPTMELPNRGEREQYYAEDTHPAIVERAVYEAAQSLQKCRKDKYHAEPKTKRMPLGAALSCGVCGGNFRQKHINGRTYWLCRDHDVGKERCPITQIPEEEIHAAFLRMYYKLKHHGEPILTEMLSQLSKLRNRRMLWSEDIIALNKRIGDISEQNRLLCELKSSGLVDSDFYIRSSNELAEMLRIAKLEKERFLSADGDDTIPKTRELLELLDSAPDFLDNFDESWFGDIVDKIIVESNDRLLFQLKNGLELLEPIERTVR